MKLSASSLWRVEKCAASAVLPHDEKPRVYRDQERGQREHKAAEQSPPFGAIPEVAFAFNVLSGRAREVGRSIGRDYGKLEEGEIPGTTDRLYVQEDHVLVEDIKTGVGYMQAEPAINPQLQHNALSAALVYGKPRAIVQLVYTKTGEVKDAEFDALDFAAIHERLLGIWGRCDAAWRFPSSRLVELGLLVRDDKVQCWRCPAKKHCPLQEKK